MKVKVLVVDAQRLFREMLVAFLCLQGTMEVRDAGDGEEALREISAWQPDVVLVDLEIPTLDGLRVAEETRRRAPLARVVVLTGCDGERLLIRAVQVGACGYLLKDVAPSRVAEAVGQAHRGEAPLDPRMAVHLLSRVASRSMPSPSPAAPSELGLLTDRERDVVRLIGCSQSNREISQLLFLSENTVKVHVSNILRKLGLGDRVGIAILAARCGLAEREDRRTAPVG